VARSSARDKSKAGANSMGKPRGIQEQKARPFNDMLFKQMVFHLENSLEVMSHGYR